MVMNDGQLPNVGQHHKLMISSCTHKMFYEKQSRPVRSSKANRPFLSEATFELLGAGSFQARESHISPEMSEILPIRLSYLMELGRHAAREGQTFALRSLTFHTEIAGARAQLRSAYWATHQDGDNLSWWLRLLQG